MQDPDKDLENAPEDGAFENNDMMDDAEGFEDDAYFDDGGFDEEFDDGGWDEEEFNDGQASKPKKAKKSIGFNTIVIGIALIIGLVIVFFQFAKSPPGAQQDGPKEIPFVSALVPTGQVNNPITGPAEQARKEREAAQNQAEQSQGFLQNADLLNNQSEAAQDENAQDANNAPPMPAPITGGAIETEAPLTPMPDASPSEDVNALIESAVVDELRTPDNPPVLEAGADLLADGAEAVGEGVNSAADLLKEKLAERETQETENVLEEQVEAPATDVMRESDAVASGFGAEEEPAIEKMAQVAAMADNQDVASLREELEQARQEISNVQEAKNEAVSSLENEIDSLRAELEQTKKQLSAAQKSAEPKAATSTPSKPVVKKAPATPKKAAAPKRKSWELRAAQPGKAWVSEKGGKEMRSVVVGDELSGIGRVTSITYAGGVWTVQGTQGKITQ